MINKTTNRGFLIDLDLAIQEHRIPTLGPKERKTGTRPFMAVAALQGEPPSFMHDLESFFCVLFWVCIHYEAPGKGRVVEQFDECNNSWTTCNLACMKLGTVVGDEDFQRTMDKHFTEYSAPLAPWVDELRKVVFPEDRRWTEEDEWLYERMAGVLEEACKSVAETVVVTEQRC
jgi:hypothetical protein